MLRRGNEWKGRGIGEKTVTCLGVKKPTKKS